jgi:hypothetical protein
MSKPMRLNAGLIAKKGEAAPAPVVIQPVGATIAAPSQQITSPSATAQATQARLKAPPPKGGNTNTIAVTVRLDPDRYQALKLYGVKTRTSNQDVLVSALDQYLNGQAE